MADKQTYDEDTQFNENNIGNYLAELEEYISNFITMIASVVALVEAVAALRRSKKF